MPRLLLYISVFLLLACVTGKVGGQGTWERLEVPTHQSLRTVFFIDSLNGWIGGDSGVILRTRNGGNHWEQQVTGVRYEVTSIWFDDRDRGWASAFNHTEPPFGTVLFKTNNGGDTWNKWNYPEENIFITSIFYFDSLHGWMGGKPHAIVRTNDGGLTWSHPKVDTSVLAFFPVLTIQFYNQRYGYATGGMFDIAGVVWRTSDGGDSWQAMDPSFAPADEVHGIHMFDSLRVLGAGGDPDFGYGVGMNRSFDGGVNWTYEELDIQGYAMDIDFRTPTEAWAPLGPQLKLIYSLDSGTTWKDIISPDSMAIYKMTFPDSLHGYAVGQDGAFLKFNPPLKPSTGPGYKMPESGHMLLPPVPNPATGYVRFRVWFKGTARHHGFIQNHSGYQLFMSDCSGMTVKTVEIPASGEEVSVYVSLEGIAPGIYLCSLRHDGNVVTGAGVRKLVVTK